MPPTLARVGEQASVQCIVEGGSPRPAVRLFITISIINIIIIFTIVIIKQTAGLLMVMIIMVQNEDPTISASPGQSPASMYLTIRSSFTSASTLGWEVVAAGCRGGKLTMCALSSR